MKAETVKYTIPQSVKFTGKQMKQIRDAWCVRWGREPKAFEYDADETDILDEAETLGFVQLPEGWKA